MRRNTISALALASLFTLALPLAADAQTSQPPQERERGEMRMGDRGRMVNHARMAGPGGLAERILALREELALTDAQATRIAEVAAQLRDRNAPLLAQMERAREEMRARHQEMTAEQRKEMREHRSAMRDGIRADTGRAHTAEQHRRMTAEQRRDMTAEQRKEMREGMRAQMAERGAAMRRQPMEGGARRMVPDELGPVMDQVRENTQAAMQEVRSILTAEQQEKLRELRAAPRGPARR